MIYWYISINTTLHFNPVCAVNFLITCTQSTQSCGRTEQYRVKNAADSHSNNSPTQGLQTHLARLGVLRTITQGGSELGANPTVFSSLIVANTSLCVQILISCLSLLNNMQFLCREVIDSMPMFYFRIM